MGRQGPSKMIDRVELAFKRMDKNGDGFISWEEFMEVNS